MEFPCPYCKGWMFADIGFEPLPIAEAFRGLDAMPAKLGRRSYRNGRCLRSDSRRKYRTA